MEHHAAVDPVRRSRAMWLVPLMVLGLAGLFVWLNVTGLVGAPGFLGTRATLGADINLILELLLLAGLYMGFRFARQDNIQLHQYNQTTWVLVNLVLLGGVMYNSYHQNVEPGVPQNLGQPVYGVAYVHMLLGGAAIACAVYLILRMNGLLPKALRVKWWKNLMRATLGLYTAAVLAGLATYYVWYIAPV